ncbi:MAG: DNA-processing protein DprA, partial [Rhodoferax sp.]|nr:DNA-processing protein DprA [Rhodoferax sp.]
MERTELTCWLRLLLTDGIGRTAGRKLLATFGLPQAVFEQSAAALEQIVSPAQVDALLQEPPELAEQTETTWQWLHTEPDTRRLLTLGDALYPQRLLETEDPPLLLFASGMAAAWQHNLLNRTASSCIAIVGSRNPTPQGAENARQFAQALTQAGLCVVSGMAMGVDGAAHEGALQGALSAALSATAPGALVTIAVVGTGLDRVYPRQHRDLAHRITAHGLLLSELPLGSGP